MDLSTHRAGLGGGPAGSWYSVGCSTPCDAGDERRRCPCLRMASAIVSTHQAPRPGGTPLSQHLPEAAPLHRMACPSSGGGDRARAADYRRAPPPLGPAADPLLRPAPGAARPPPASTAITGAGCRTWPGRGTRRRSWSGFVASAAAILSARAGPLPSRLAPPRPARRAAPSDWPASSASSVSLLAARPAPASPRGWPCQSAPLPCCAWFIAWWRLHRQRPASWPWMIGRGGAAGTTEPSWSTWSATGSSTCCPTGR